MFVMMTRKELYQYCFEGISNIHSDGEASAMSKLLAEKLGWKPAKLKDDMVVENEEIEFINEAISRISKHEPIQYITGNAWFCNMLFDVNPSVLIPRPETEELVAEAIKFLNGLDCPRIIDIGSGSGCIPVSIAKKIEACCIVSVDVSDKAIETAVQNADKLKAHVHFITMNFLDENNWSEFDRFDCIISNPPYIPENEKARLDKNVAEYEPSLALFVKDGNPLLFYEAILKFAKSHLSGRGKIFLEVHQDHAPGTKQLFEKNNFTAEIKKDINRNERMLIATRSL